MVLGISIPSWVQIEISAEEEQCFLFLRNINTKFLPMKKKNVRSQMLFSVLKMWILQETSLFSSWLSLSAVKNKIHHHLKSGLRLFLCMLTHVHVWGSLQTNMAVSYTLCGTSLLQFDLYCLPPLVKYKWSHAGYSKQAALLKWNIVQQKVQEYDVINGGMSLLCSGRGRKSEVTFIHTTDGAWLLTEKCCTHLFVLPQ